MASKQTLEDIVRRKLGDPRTLYLLGAGASCCAGLPGTRGLTDSVSSKLGSEARSDFNRIGESLIRYRTKDPNIEDILSELHHRLGDAGLKSEEKSRLRRTFDEICLCIRSTLSVGSPTEYHKEFVQRLVSRREAEPARKAPPVQIFTTNYDLLIELACEESGLVPINGFEGIFGRRWNPGSFDVDVGRATAHVLSSRFEPSARYVRIYKLHGSLSWFEDRGQFWEGQPERGSRAIPLIIYPSRIKYAESISPPFDWLFRRFNDAIKGADVLVCIGYGFGDNHLNQYVLSALQDRLSILALSKEPVDALADFRTHPRVSVVNEREAIIDGRERDEAGDFWCFERFSSLDYSQTRTGAVYKACTD